MRPEVRSLQNALIKVDTLKEFADYTNQSLEDAKSLIQALEEDNQEFTFFDITPTREHTLENVVEEIEEYFANQLEEIKIALYLREEDDDDEDAFDEFVFENDIYYIKEVDMYIMERF